MSFEKKFAKRDKEEEVEEEVEELAPLDEAQVKSLLHKPQGLLDKQRDHFRSQWRPRWFVLDMETKELSYHYISSNEPRLTLRRKRRKRRKIWSHPLVAWASNPSPKRVPNLLDARFKSKTNSVTPRSISLPLVLLHPRAAGHGTWPRLAKRLDSCWYVGGIDWSGGKCRGIG